MIKSFFRILLFVISFSFIFENLYSQEEITKGQFENVLSRFVNYRFGTISLWRVKNISEIRKAIKEREAAASGVVADESVTKSADPRVASAVEEGVKGGDDIDQIRQELVNRGLPLPPAEEMNALFQYYKSLESGPVATVENAYLVTTRPERGQIPSSIIALIVSYNPPSSLDKDLKTKSTSEIYTFDELRNFKLDTGYTSDNMYDLMVNTLVQQNVENMTLQAQGIGNPQWFVGKQHGITSRIISTEEDVSSYDIQTMERVSRGEPLDYRLNQNEVTVSPDLLSWRSFRLPTYYDNNGNPVVDSTRSTNSDLPKFGVELKYGLEEINYPSFWSERLTLSALWENVKLGMILPTNGWSSIGQEVFDQERKLTHAGVGIAGGIDFPIKVIPKSGVFQTSFGYVFGDAKESSYKNRKIDPATYVENTNDLDYLIRANAQIHYTFGVSIDEDYLIRFGLGGTVYNVESWYNKVTEDAITGDRSVALAKFHTETIGGISGRVDFMVRNVVTPFGASAQYFDEGIYTNIWLSIPVIDNTLAIRLDAKGYFNSVFRNTPHPWENKSVFIPMARFIITF
jgi:hypothetical protein